MVFGDNSVSKQESFPDPHNEKLLDSRECSALKEIILQNEKSVKELGPDIYDGRAGNDSLTGRYSVYNWLNNSEFRDIFLPKLKNFFLKSHYSFPIIIQCWANTFRKNEGIKIHDHSTIPFVMSANVFICGDPNIGTVFVIDGKEQHISNEEGGITIFPGNTLHYVNPNPTNDVRISIAMDIYLNDSFSDFVVDQKNYNRYYKIEN